MNELFNYLFCHLQYKTARSSELQAILERARKKAELQADGDRASTRDAPIVRPIKRQYKPKALTIRSQVSAKSEIEPDYDMDSGENTPKTPNHKHIQNGENRPTNSSLKRVETVPSISNFTPPKPPPLLIPASSPNFNNAEGNNCFHQFTTLSINSIDV